LAVGGLPRPERAVLIHFVVARPPALRSKRLPRPASTSSGIGTESALSPPSLRIAWRYGDCGTPWIVRSVFESGVRTFRRETWSAAPIASVMFE